MFNSTQPQTELVPFFCSQPLGLFLKSFPRLEKIRRAFTVAEEGDFVMNLLSLCDVDKVHVCGALPKHAMTVEIKKSLLGRSNWKNLQTKFFGPHGSARLHKTGHWLPESFSQILNLENSLHYLSNMDAYLKLKKQLSKIEISSGNILRQLENLEPYSFDLIYLGSALDQPGIYSLDDWPRIIKSRLTDQGQVIALTNQPKQYVADRISDCGFCVDEPVRITLPGFVNTSTFLVFSPK